MIYGLVGLFVGGLSTLIGLGGGFLVVPLLLTLHPEMSAAHITGISLFCVTLNAISGSTQYFLRKQIHITLGLVLAIASWPGAWVGLELSKHIERKQFETVYGLFLSTLGFYLLWRSRHKMAPDSGAPIRLEKRDYGKGALVSSGVGILVGFFGVGGGVIHVPFLHQAFRFPMHLATGTSQFILAITSLAVVMQHWHEGSLDFSSDSFILPLAIGMMMGAQISARHSKRVSSTGLLRILAISILLVAFKIFYKSLF